MAITILITDGYRLFYNFNGTVVNGYLFSRSMLVNHKIKSVYIWVSTEGSGSNLSFNLKMLC